jgi:hypothetical protein
LVDFSLFGGKKDIKLSFFSEFEEASMQGLSKISNGMEKLGHFMSTQPENEEFLFIPME